MTYLVLARKYRPRTFADVVGQDVATATLRGAIEEGRIGHAYLFCGPRGTGKTTMARIFAKVLNCERGPAAEPCGACERCQAAEAGTEIDLVEIDAASNRGIDDIRSLRESASYRPMRARFKVFIVDEAHMLTKEAVNAFLKTLEEPPPHVKLFFATTEPEKLLPTFVSRCQVVRLALIPEDAIAARLEQVFARESLRPGAGVSQELARRSRGGLRDALSLADQLVSLVGDEPALSDLARLAGGAGVEEVEALLDRLEAGDRAGVLRGLPAVEGNEREILAGLLSGLRATSIAGLCGRDHPLLEVEPELRQKISARFERLGCERIQVWMAELLRARERIELLRAVPARLILEVVLLDLCRAEIALPLADIEERLLELEARLESRPASPAAASTATSAARPPAVRSIPALSATPSASPSGASTPSSSTRRVSTSGASTPGGPTARAGESSAGSRAPRGDPPAAASGAVSAEPWPALLALLDAEARAVGEILRARGKLETCADGRAQIRLSGLRAEERAIVSEPRNVRTISNAFARVIGAPVDVALQIGDGPVPQSKGSADLFTQRVADSFGGRIVEGT